MKQIHFHCPNCDCPLSFDLQPYKPDPTPEYVVEATCPQCQFPIRAGANQYKIIEKGMTEDGKK